MKAKMPESQKPQEPGEYECLWCDCIFDYDPQQGSFQCPNCGSTDRKDVVPIFMVDNPTEEKMYTADDFHGGA